MMREGHKNNVYYLHVHIDVEQRSKFDTKQNESKFVLLGGEYNTNHQ